MAVPLDRESAQDDRESDPFDRESAYRSNVGYGPSSAGGYFYGQGASRFVVVGWISQNPFVGVDNL